MRRIALSLAALTLSQTAWADCTYTGAKRAYLECIANDALNALSGVASLASDLLGLSGEIEQAQSDLLATSSDVAALSAALGDYATTADLNGAISASEGAADARFDLIEGDLAVIEGAYLTAASVGTTAGTIAAGDDARFGLWTGSSSGLDAATGRASLGLGTAATSAASSFATSAQGTTADLALARSGGTMTGALTLAGAPTSALHAATRQYVDAAAPSQVPYGRCAVDTQTGNAGTYLTLGVCTPGLRGGMAKNASNNRFVAPRSGVYSLQFTTHIAGDNSGCSVWFHNATTGQRAGQNSPTNMANASGLLYAEAGEEIGLFAISCALQFGLPQHSNALFDYVSMVWVGP
jgi:hypothetical protein